MAAITLRLTKGLPLTNAEIDANFSNLNTELGSLGTSYNPSDVLSKLLTVDGTGSALDADLVDGLDTASTNTPDTVVIRDASGNFAANEITANKFVGNLELGSLKTLTFEGDTDNLFETTISVVDPTADRTILFPNESGTVVITGGSSSANSITTVMLTDASVTNAKLENSSVTIDGLSVSLGGSISPGFAKLSANNSFTGTQSFPDNKFEITDNISPTKKLTFELSGITDGATRTLSVPNSSGTIATTSYVSTFVNTTAAMTAGTINSVNVSSIGTNATNNKTISTAAPTGGSSGDVWYRV